jgi:CRISPR-associated protein Cas5h
MTITQNLTLSTPPKTTIGGMLAAILGIDYNDYFTDEDYFSFGYSVCIGKPLRKKSFAQNYVEDYTKKSESRFAALCATFQADTDLNGKRSALATLRECGELSAKEEVKLVKLQGQQEKGSSNFGEQCEKLTGEMSKRMTKPKPIYRELLIDPEFLIFVHDFKHEDILKQALIRHESSYALYMGNSEFPANFEVIVVDNFESAALKSLHSFCSSTTSMEFEAGKRYTNQYSATRTAEGRRYQDYRNVILCDQEIKLKQAVQGFRVKTHNGAYNCEFI